MSPPKLKGIYQDLKGKSTEEIEEIIADNERFIVFRLSKFGEKALHLYAGLAYAMIGADFKVRPEEFCIVKPIMDAVFNIDSTIEIAEEMILKNGFTEKELRESMREALVGIGGTDPELRDRIVLVLICIAAIDGDICRRERAFIESLF